MNPRGWSGEPTGRTDVLAADGWDGRGRNRDVDPFAAHGGQPSPRPQIRRRGSVPSGAVVRRARLARFGTCDERRAARVARDRTHGHRDQRSDLRAGARRLTRCAAPARSRLFPPQRQGPRDHRSARGRVDGHLARRRHEDCRRNPALHARGRPRSDGRPTWPFLIYSLGGTRARVRSMTARRPSSPSATCETRSAATSCSLRCDA